MSYYVLWAKEKGRKKYVTTIRGREASRWGLTSDRHHALAWPMGEAMTVQGIVKQILKKTIYMEPLGSLTKRNPAIESIGTKLATDIIGGIGFGIGAGITERYIMRKGKKNPRRGRAKKNIFVWNNARGGAYDPHAATELDLYITNDAALYRQQYLPIIKNLITKRVRGIFDPQKAVKLFMYLMESGAKKYAKEFDAPGARWHDVFSKPTREHVARDFVKRFVGEADLGNYDHLLPKKYQKNPRRRSRVRSPYAVCTSVGLRQGTAKFDRCVKKVGARKSNPPRRKVRKNIFVWNNPRRTYDVIVGNIGTVYSGPSKKEADKAYKEYVAQSKSGYGRVAGEGVVLMEQGEIIKEHIGTVESNPLTRREIASLFKGARREIRGGLTSPHPDVRAYRMGTASGYAGAVIQAGGHAAYERASKLSGKAFRLGITPYGTPNPRRKIVANPGGKQMYNVVAYDPGHPPATMVSFVKSKSKAEDLVAIYEATARKEGRRTRYKVQEFRPRSNSPMTLAKWAAKQPAQIKRHGSAWVVPDVPGLVNRQQAWQLSDYLVSSVAGGSIWFTKKSRTSRSNRKAKHNPKACKNPQHRQKNPLLQTVMLANERPRRKSKLRLVSRKTKSSVVSGNPRRPPWKNGQRVPIETARAWVNKYGSPELKRQFAQAEKLQAKANRKATHIKWKILPIGSRGKLDAISAMVYYGSSPETLYKPPKGSKKGKSFYKHDWGEKAGGSRPLSVLTTSDGRAMILPLRQGQTINDWMRG